MTDVMFGTNTSFLSAEPVTACKGDMHSKSFGNISLGNFGRIEAARHMGYFGDINQGNQWLFTNNAGDSRWGGNENRRAIVFLRW